MEFLNSNLLAQHLIRFILIIFSIGFAVILGNYRPEWKSRKTLICWIWTMAAIDLLIMDGDLARSLSAQLFIGGAIMLNVINFIGDRIETIKFKDFSASMKGAEEKKEPIPYVTANPDEWPDGGEEPEEEPVKIYKDKITGRHIPKKDK